MAVIGVLKEIKDNENRVGLPHWYVEKLVKAGHRVLVQEKAGNGSGFGNELYEKAGAELVVLPEDIVKEVDILVKVKEPIAKEYQLLEMMKGKTLYTYLHLAACDPELTKALCYNNITAIAYETIEDSEGKLPCLTPMSEVAGVLAIQYGAQYLQKKYGGRGVTLGHINGANPAQTVVVGAGVVGKTAAITAAGMGGKVALLELNEERLEEVMKEFKEKLGEELYKNVEFVKSSAETVSEYTKKADLLVGAVLVTGAKAPTVVGEEDVKNMKWGAVIVDVAIDQGGCIWGARPTSHTEPIYKVDNKIFCCITNMPGQASHQSTEALTSTTWPYLEKMAELGVDKAIEADVGLKKGVNCQAGKIRYKAVAEGLDLMRLYEEF